MRSQHRNLFLWPEQGHRRTKKPILTQWSLVNREPHTRHQGRGSCLPCLEVMLHKLNCHPSPAVFLRKLPGVVSACEENISSLRLAASKHTTVHCSWVKSSQPGSSGRPDLLFFMAADAASEPAPSPPSDGLATLSSLKVLLTQKLLPGSAVNRHVFRFPSPVTNFLGVISSWPLPSKTRNI